MEATRNGFGSCRLKKRRASSHVHRSGNHFIRPEESFLGQGRTPVFASDTPKWTSEVLPPHPSVMLQSSVPGAGGDGGLQAGGGDAVVGDMAFSKVRMSGDLTAPGAGSPGAEVSPGPPGNSRRPARFRCHTCSEKLATLNSLRTHLKSHARPAATGRVLPVSLRSDHRVPSLVVTSKYGRRRAVISALVAAKPGPHRR